VGYTNAGKSTLLNRLTRSEVKAENKLFATLDPSSRRLRFPREREVIVTDTVGFIRDLPPDLVAGFRATLEEIREADVLLLVADLSDPALESQIESVRDTLCKLDLADKPECLILNKCDRVDEGEAVRIAGRLGGVLTSATRGTGIDEMLEAVEKLAFPVDGLGSARSAMR
jgi:GTP-binding protein HflX